MRGRHIPLLLLVGSSLLLSCRHTPAYMHYEALGDEGWEQGEERQFLITALPAAGCYDLSLLLRATDEYPYTSIDIDVSCAVLPAREQHRDTLSCTLYDAQGHTRGTGIRLRQYAYALASRSLLPTDSIVITVRHAMHDGMLHGITDVGIAAHSRE